MGQPAARIGDMHVCPMVHPACRRSPRRRPDPAARRHHGPDRRHARRPRRRHGRLRRPARRHRPGSFTVLICGQPAARMGDMTAHGGAIVMGYPTVLIS